MFKKLFVVISLICSMMFMPAWADVAEGEISEVGAICKTYAAMKDVSIPFAAEQYAEAQKKFEEYVKQNECTMAPTGAKGRMFAPEKIGKPFNDPDGDFVQAYVVRVGEYYALMFEILRKGGST